MIDPLNTTNANRVSGSGSTQDLITEALAGRGNRVNDATLGFQDFLTLIVAQLQNQDMMNPMDGTEFVSQMATFSSLMAINNMVEQTKISHATSLLGKEVTVAQINPLTGRLEVVEGIVTGVALFDLDGPKIFVNDGEIGFSLQSVMSVGRLPEVSSPPPGIRADNIPNGTAGAPFTFTFAATGTGDAELKWNIQSGVLPEGLTLSEDGVLSGTPVHYGTFSFTVRATGPDDLVLTRTFGLVIARAEDSNS